MRQLKTRLSAVWGHRLLVTLVWLYFVVGIVLLAVRYGLPPLMETLRPTVAAQWSKAAGMPVHIGRLALRWQGWNPRLDVQGLQLHSTAGQALLSVPEATIRLDWSGVRVARAPRLFVQVRGLDLRVERDAAGDFHAFGQVFRLDEVAMELPTWLVGLLAKPRLQLLDTTLRWHDGLRRAPALTLRGLDVRLQSTSGGELAIRATQPLPAPLGNSAQLSALLPPASRWAERDAWDRVRVHLQADSVALPAWRPWVEIPELFSDDAVSLQAWVQRTGSQALRFAVQTRGVSLHEAAWFESPVPLGAIDGRGQVDWSSGLRVRLDQLRWYNADIDVTLAGAWHPGGAAGQADLQGTIARGQLNAIHRYLPRIVHEDARDWLKRGLQAGVLHDAQVVLRGDLAEFPFGDHPQRGDFLVSGPYEAAQIDYVPAVAGEPPWPKLLDMSGVASLHRTHLSLTADRAQMRPTEDQPIELTQIKADIDDIEGDAILTVSGQTRALGSAYLALIRTSPLSAILDHVFDAAQATGTWAVPLSLTVPLVDPESVTVDGHVVFNDASLRLTPDLPPFEALRGSLHFTELALTAQPGFTARILGSPVTLTGELGQQAAGLLVSGRLSAKALATRAPAAVMKRVQGSLPYRLRIARNSKGYELTLNSDLRGLALDFPAPLAKPADQARHLQLIWSNRAAQDDTLAIDLGDDVALRLRHRRGQTTGPYFDAVSVGVGHPPPPADGLSVQVVYPLLDLDVWYGILQEWAPPAAGPSAASFPALHVLSLQVDQARALGNRLDHLVLRLVHEPADDQWSLNLRSTQTAGTLKWRTAQGRIQGRVAARFDRLSLGADAGDGVDLLPQDDQELDFSDDLNIPAVVLQVDALRLYGHPLGRLSLEGVRDAATGNWRLASFSLGTPDARLTGSGLWRLRGAQRGLSVQSEAKLSNLGAWMENAGFHDILDGGQGTLKGTLDWQNFPWTHQKSQLQGDLSIALDKGRFNKLGSATAKLLELLSIQSVSRLGSLDRGLAGLTQEGFPFDQLRGQIHLAHGVARAKDYKVIGPVGTILLEGDTNIVQKTLDLQAVIVPNLDVSGAAIAAGIAINPLVGVGAFLSQLLLKYPLAKAMTARYHVTGSWEAPRIQEEDEVREAHREQTAPRKDATTVSP